MDKESLNKKLIYNLIKYCSVVFFPTLAFAYVSRILLPDGIGRINAARAFGNYFSLAAAFGIASYGVREVAKNRSDKEQMNKVTAELFVLSLITTSVVSVTYLVIAVFFPPLKLDHKLVLYNIILIVFNGIALDWFFYGVENIRYIAIRTLIFQFLGMLFIMCFVKGTGDIYKYYLLYIISGSGYWIVNYISFFRRNRLSFVKLNVGRHFLPALQLLIMTAISNINFDIDVSFINHFMTDADVGIYTVGHKVPYMVIMLVGSGIGVVVASRISYIYHNKSREEYHQIASQMFNLFVMMSVPCCIGAFSVSREIVIAFSGSAFEESRRIVKMLSIVILLSGITSGIRNTVIFPAERDGAMTGIGIISVLINIVGNWVFIRLYGLIGVAVCTVVSESVNVILYMITATAIVKIKGLFKSFWQYPAAALCIPVFAGLIRNVTENVFLYLLIVVILSALAYFGILCLLKNELMMIAKDSIRARIKKERK